MIVRFENLLSRQSITKHYSHQKIKLLKSRTLWSINDEIYWIVNVIDFTSHYNVLISPLYAWEKMACNGDWSIFDLVTNDEVYAEKLTDKLCLRHKNTEPGLSDKSGNAVYLSAYKFDIMPALKCGDVFVFDDAVHVVESFEIHRRLYGATLIDRVIVISHDMAKVAGPEHTAIVSSERMVKSIDNLLKEKDFLGEYDDRW